MKRLSKDERKGAVALALVVAVMMVGAFMYRNFRHEDDGDAPQVTVIYKDTAAIGGKEAAVKKERKHKKSSKKRERKTSEKGSKAVRAPAPPRDFLTDTIARRNSISQ